MTTTPKSPDWAKLARQFTCGCDECEGFDSMENPPPTPMRVHGKPVEAFAAGYALGCAAIREQDAKARAEALRVLLEDMKAHLGSVNSAGNDFYRGVVQGEENGMVYVEAHIEALAARPSEPVRAKPSPPAVPTAPIASTSAVVQPAVAAGGDSPSPSTTPGEPYDSGATCAHGVSSCDACTDASSTRDRDLRARVKELEGLVDHYNRWGNAGEPKP